MSDRCNTCGSKECCGASMQAEVARLTAVVDAKDERVTELTRRTVTAETAMHKAVRNNMGKHPAAAECYHGGPIYDMLGLLQDGEISRGKAIQWMRTYFLTGEDEGLPQGHKDQDPQAPSVLLEQVRAEVARLGGELKKAREVVCYQPCDAHMGLPLTLTVTSAPPVRKVCPHCPAPADEESER